MPTPSQKPTSKPTHPAHTPRPPPSRTARPKGQGQGMGHPDIRQTKEYKLAARRWTSTIVALPIVLYTSYILYERIYGNQAPKKIPVRAKQESTPGQGNESSSSS